MKNDELIKPMQSVIDNDDINKQRISVILFSKKNARKNYVKTNEVKEEI